MTHSELLEYSKIGRKIKKLETLYEEEGRRISDPRSPDFSGVARGSGSPDAYHNSLDIRSTLLADIEDLKMRRKHLYRKLFSVMDLLPGRAHQDAFTQLYLHGDTVKDAARTLHFSLSYMYKLREDICSLAAAVT